MAKVLSSRSFEAVMHFAASIEAGESMMDPGKFYRNNLCNSLQLIDRSAGGCEALCALFDGRSI